MSSRQSSLTYCLTLSCRYVNMDYIFLSSLMGIAVACVLISYDIACQWSRNLTKRVKAFPLSMQEAFLRILLLFAVPKFHLPAHGGKCQSPYALGLIKGAGRVDGEGIERGWSLMNAIATATREMGPGFRHDTMDDHWQSLNWRKIVGLGEYEHHVEAEHYSLERLQGLPYYANSTKQSRWLQGRVQYLRTSMQLLLRTKLLP